MEQDELDYSNPDNYNKEDIDAYCLKHEGNYVLVMTPWVARSLHELSGNVNGKGPFRDATSKVWDAMEELNSLDPDHYIIDDDGPSTIFAKGEKV